MGCESEGMIKIIYQVCSDSRSAVTANTGVKWGILVAEWNKELTEKKAAGVCLSDHPTLGSASVKESAEPGKGTPSRPVKTEQNTIVPKSQ